MYCGWNFNAKHRSWNPHGTTNKAGTALHNYARHVVTPSRHHLTPPGYPASLTTSHPYRHRSVLWTQQHHSEYRYELTSDHNPVHFVINFNFHISHLLNCKTSPTGTNFKTFSLQ
ncbi:hypothetical protein TNCT_687861 [Trichonephila clavata]|uniref:Uncharacterized protein n=1 Tax=Trichonephila clavata TaxID=2740835 RepID=A0A8X6K5U8_TRICU|nr:hypothetical protein TNCT_687861 [Trichonephila clavata]